MLLETPEYFFVYGTLKAGYGNNRILDDAEFVDFAISYDTKYKMQCNGSFPMVKEFPESEDTYAVVGELYKVNDLTTILALDRLESNGFLYLRVEREFVLLDTDEVITAWIYLYLPDFDKLTNGLAPYYIVDDDEDKNLTFAPYLFSEETKKRMCEWHRD